MTNESAACYYTNYCDAIKVATQDYLFAGVHGKELDIANYIIW
jgi:hypothetical protein